MKPKDRNPKPRGKGIAETPELARIVDEWRRKRAEGKRPERSDGLR